jgi:hypothetical protein
MITDDEKLERIREFLSGRLADFVLVYRVEKSKAGPELKWIKAASLDIKDCEDCEELAAKYQEIATYSYKIRRNMMLEEYQLNQDTQTRIWHGLSVATGKNKVPAPTNSLGQRWWHLVIGAGATRKAGYVIVTRVAAKNLTDLRKCIAEIQSIIVEAGHVFRLVLIFLSLLNSIKIRRKVAA